MGLDNAASGGDFDINSSTVSLLNGSIANVSDDTVVNASALLVDNSTLNSDISLSSAGTLTLQNTGILDAASNEITMANTDTRLIILDGTVTAGSLRSNGSSGTTFDTGSITLSEANSFKSNNGFDGTDFDWVGDAGDGLLTDLDSSDSTGRTLAQRLWSGYFAIDGIRIDPAGDGFNPLFDSTIGADIDALNAELAANYIIGGRHFLVGFDSLDPTANAMTLELVVAIPEPATISLMALFSLGVLSRRRYGQR